MKTALLFLLLVASVNAFCQQKKERFWMMGLEASLPITKSWSTCNYDVKGAGLVAERGWAHSKRFALILSGSYFHYSGYTSKRELGKKDFNYISLLVGERLYAYKKLFVQGQIGLSSWGLTLSPALGYQYKNINLQATYRSAAMIRTAECYVHPNTEHWGFRISYVLNK